MKRIVAQRTPPFHVRKILRMNQIHPSARGWEDTENRGRTLVQNSANNSFVLGLGPLRARAEME